MEPIGYVNRSTDLDAIFAALADPTRRAILTRLAKGAASVQDLAEPFTISQAAVSKHLKVLEHAGLIDRSIDRQKRPAKLKAAPLESAVDWLNVFQKFWSSSFEQLEELLAEINKAEQLERDDG